MRFGPGPGSLSQPAPGSSVDTSPYALKQADKWKLERYKKTSTSSARDEYNNIDHGQLSLFEHITLYAYGARS